MGALTYYKLSVDGLTGWLAGGPAGGRTDLVGRKNNNMTSKLSYAVTGPQWTHALENSTDTTTSYTRVCVSAWVNKHALFQTDGNRTDGNGKDPSYWAC